MTTTEAEASEKARKLVTEHWVEAWDRSRVVNASPLDEERVRGALQRSKSAERALLSYIASLEARVEELEGALKGMRRSDGRGGFHDCFCDSERGGYSGGPAPSHAKYCRIARAALRQPQADNP